MAYLLGIDIGTSGTKTALFDETGKKIMAHTVSYPLYQPFNGYAEQEPEDWTNAAFEGIRAVISKAGVSGDEITGIGLSGQMHGLVMLDGEGRPLRKSIIWCDQRTAAECEEMTRIVGRDTLMKITAAPAMTGFTASKILWVRRNEPDTYQKCRHILLPKDYVRFCLTDEFATEVSDASGMQLLDIAGRCWSEELLSKLGIDRALLPTVYESPEVSGRVSAAAAIKTGLRAGTPVVGGAGDNAAAAIGTGVVSEGKAFTTIGTSGVVFAHTDKMLCDPQGRIHSFCHAVPGKWHVMGVTQAAGLSLKWFRDNFCSDEINEASKTGAEVYDIMSAAAAKIPVGSNRLIYLPYLMGERTPHLNPDARGVFFGLSAMHTKADLTRAIMEGVSFSLRDCLGIFRELKINVNSMTACGGGGSSALWRQMLADNFGCTVSTVLSAEGGALGAALLAGTGCGVYSSVEEACKAVIKIKSSVEPNAQDSAKYNKFYDIYRQLYPEIKSTFSNLKMQEE